MLVALIAGVGGDGTVTYHDSPDQAFQDDFGIGPGCSSAAGTALPPVRMREVAEALQVGDEPVMYRAVRRRAAGRSSRVLARADG